MSKRSKKFNVLMSKRSKKFKPPKPRKSKIIVPKIFRENLNKVEKPQEELVVCCECKKHQTKKTTKKLFDGRYVCFECLFTRYEKYRSRYEKTDAKKNSTIICAVCGKVSFAYSWINQRVKVGKDDPDGRWSDEHIRIRCCSECAKIIQNRSSPFLERYYKVKHKIDLFEASEYLRVFFIQNDEGNLMWLLRHLVFDSKYGVKVFRVLREVVIDEINKQAKNIAGVKDVRSKAQLKITQIEQDFLDGLNQKRKMATLPNGDYNKTKISELEYLIFYEIAVETKQELLENEVLEFLLRISFENYSFVFKSPVLSKYLGDEELCKKIFDEPSMTTLVTTLKVYAEVIGVPTEKKPQPLKIFESYSMPTYIPPARQIPRPVARCGA